MQRKKIECIERFCTAFINANLYDSSTLLNSNDKCVFCCLLVLLWTATIKYGNEHMFYVKLFTKNNNLFSVTLPLSHRRYFFTTFSIRLRTNALAEMVSQAWRTINLRHENTMSGWNEIKCNLFRFYPFAFIDQVHVRHRMCVVSLRHDMTLQSNRVYLVD